MAAPPSRIPSSSSQLAAAAAVMARTSMSSSFRPAAASKLTMSSCTTETAQGMHLFNVNQYSLLKDLGVGRSVRSGAFHVGGHSWAVLFYPSGSEAPASGGHHHVSVYLELLTLNATDVRAVFDLSLIDCTGRLSSLFDEDTTKGRRYAVFSTLATVGNLPPHHPPRCWGVSSFKGSKLETPTYIQDDGLTIRCDINVIKPPHVSETRQVPQIDVPPPSLPNDFGKLLEEEDGADVTVLVQGESFSAHRAVLAARSPVLRKKLHENTNENEHASRLLITMHDMEPAVFRAMLHFIYTDTLPPGAGDHDDKARFLRRLFTAAEGCAVERLKRLCESLMCSNLSKWTLKTTMAFAEQHRCDRLRAACVEFGSAFYPPGTIASELYKRLKRSLPGPVNAEADKRLKTS